MAVDLQSPLVMTHARKVRWPASRVALIPNEADSTLPAARPAGQEWATARDRLLRRLLRPA